MVTSSEYIQIISAGIYAMALFFTIITFRRTKRLDQITLSDNIFKELTKFRSRAGHGTPKRLP